MPVAVIKTKSELALSEQFQAALPSLPGGPEVATHRRAAIAAFTEFGLPHRRIEDWKYTDLRTAPKDPALPSVDATAKLTVADLIVALGPFMNMDAARIVFVNGHFRAALSNVTGTDTITVTPLSASFDSLSPLSTDAITALNTAFVTDGAVIDIPDGVTLEQPLLVVSLSVGRDARLSTIRNRISVGAGASATIAELYLTLPGSTVDGQTNALTEVTISRGATLTHVKALSEGGRATHLSNWNVSLGAEANYRAFQLSSGVALARNQIGVTFTGEHAKIDVSGTFLGRGSDHIDTTLTVDHAVPHCESRELFAGVLDGHARGIFQGKIIVRPHAQKSDGKMMARALMLSPDAEFDSKPELEIYADDVVCGHGSTAAELDEDLMFYCQSRGIPAAEARALLVKSFIGEAIARVDNEAVRTALEACADAWLAQDQTNSAVT
ncbi:MAG: Fe-S cluster assembly protein SufD [Hyphomicrobium aestuarii]|nr:Fe-S cluster assembly protein SufD [Hyphomicrobium aestuarii]